MASLFFSYSHADEALRDKLEVHLSSLRRSGIITTWHDRKIVAGTDFADSIDEHLETDEVILLLISPDFIASEFCYERELKKALERHARKEARVIPIILRPCEWHDLPFGRLLATPKDGKAITQWTNIDEALSDVVRAVKSAVKQLSEKKKTPAPAASVSTVNPRPMAAAEHLKIRRGFTDYDKEQFQEESFEHIAQFFENSLNQLVSEHPELNRIFRRVDPNTFSAALYVQGKKACQGSAINGGGLMMRNAIQFNLSDQPTPNSMHEIACVEEGSDGLVFHLLMSQASGAGARGQLSKEQVSEYLWGMFIKPLR